MKVNRAIDPSNPTPEMKHIEVIRLTEKEKYDLLSGRVNCCLMSSQLVCIQMTI